MIKFLCDVHISYKLVNTLKSMGYEAIHVNEILNKSSTSDSELCKFADAENYIVVTKDSDFQNSYIIKNSPKKLIKINLGNISNKSLVVIFQDNQEFLTDLRSKGTFFVVLDETGFNNRVK